MSRRFGCRETLARASNYVDGSSDARERGQVQEHLRECKDCLRAFGDNLVLARAARELPRLGVPIDIARAVRSTLAERRVQRTAELRDDVIRHPAGRAAAALAALLLAAVAGFALGRCTRDPAPVSAPVQQAVDPAPLEPAPGRPTENPSRPPRLTPVMDAVPASAPTKPGRPR